MKSVIQALALLSLATAAGGCAMALAQDNRPIGTTLTDINKVRLLEPSFYVPPTASGPKRLCNLYFLLENNTGKQIKSVNVRAKLFNDTEELLKQTLTLTTFMDPMLRDAWSSAPPNHNVYAFGQVEIDEDIAKKYKQCHMTIESVEPLPSGSGDQVEILVAKILNGQEQAVLESLKEEPELVSMKSKGGFTLLHFAGVGKSNALMDKLLSAGADPNVRTSNGMSPAAWTAIWGSREALEKLSAKGADLTVIDSSGRSLLDYAVFRGRLENVRFLCDKGAQINRTWPNGSALTFSIKNSSFTCTKELLERGADPNLVGTGVLSPASVAVMNGDVATLHLLHRANVNLNRSEANGMTLAHVAAYYGQSASMHWLATHGADLKKSVTKWGTPKETANRQQKFGMVALVDRMGGRP